VKTNLGSLATALRPDEREGVRTGVEDIQHWINGNDEWALVTGRYAAAKEGPVASAELAGRGSVDDLLAV
jgi:germacradienol/geosmin synthase